MKKKFFIGFMLGALMVAFTACTNSGQIISPTPTSATKPTDTVQPTNEPSKQPTDEPQTTPTTAPADNTPTPTNEPSNTPTPLPQKDLSEFDPLDFYKDAIYLGDSVLSHYRWRGNSQTHPEIFGKYSSKLWLVEISYAVRLALRDVSTLTTQEVAAVPKVNGEPRQVWDIVAESGKTRVFMFFGLNDIGPSGVDKFVEQYQELIAKIKAKTPAAKFYILSITSMTKDSQSKTGLNNAKIKEANEKLAAVCQEKGWSFVDVASKLRDEDYNLYINLPDGTKIFESEKVHITKAAYVFWDEALEKLAREELRKEYYEGGNK